MGPVFIGGCGRSGTTLLGAMLGSHSDGFATPESKFKFTKTRARVQRGGQFDLSSEAERIDGHPGYRLWNLPPLDSIMASYRPTSYRQLLLAIVDAYAQASGVKSARYWIDHTPANVVYAPQLFTWFPDAKLIHIVRDPRAVAASVLRLDWGPNTAAGAVRWWVDRVAHGLAAESFFGAEKVKRVRFEELVSSPEETLGVICAFLGIEFERGMIRGEDFRLPLYTRRQHALVGTGPVPSRASAWKSELSRRQVEIVESLAGNMLICFGYELEHAECARNITKTEQVTDLVREFLLSRIHRRRQRERLRRSVGTAEDG